ncbi:MAG: class I SAM-dependent methyltransferase, partial [Anaerolineae bacterium]|nr:class I SAM-dependent methyltransferase [Anaerolineae bacterium]
MSATLPPSAGLTAEAAGRTVRILESLFDAAARQRVGVRLWDGTSWPDDAPRPATLVLKHPGALRAMLLPGHELGLAEAYLYDDFDIVGDIEAIFGLADALAAATAGWRKKLVTARELLRLPPGPEHPTGRRGPARLSGKRHSIERDRQAVTYHYDVSNDFYALWLDRRMVYSCAYFEKPDDDLDTAQERKLDYICRKLRLKPGQRLLDIGCGWGGLVMHAAQRYGVNAVGITLSRPQVALANERIQAAGLAERCRVEARDYRCLLYTS